uniref:Uncharacterized protein n=1 Tax=Plectus sambesii TaxID=2011161 RepID=A0A914VUW7_9BILA
MAALKMTAAGFFICCGLISSVIFSKTFLNDVVEALGLTLFISSTPYVMFIFSAVRNRFFHFVFECCYKKASSNSSIREVNIVAGINVHRSPITKKVNVAPIDLKRMIHEAPNQIFAE